MSAEAENGVLMDLTDDNKADVTSLKAVIDPSNGRFSSFLHESVASRQSALERSRYYLHVSATINALFAQESVKMRAAFKSDVMELCNRCQEHWFGMHLNAAGVCARYSRRDANIGKDMPHMYSDANSLDPGEFPIDADLPELTQVEEMLIARVHVKVQQVQGAQYSYRGHVINFLCDTGRLYNQLPLRKRGIRPLGIEA
ncbi:hypothetical protein IWZ01DRAFT_487052 [Phyllosticta capitalensis]